MHYRLKGQKLYSLKHKIFAPQCVEKCEWFSFRYNLLKRASHLFNKYLLSTCCVPVTYWVLG